MKKTLLAGTAIVAAGLFASGAFAQEKPMGPLTVGGYFNTITAVIDQDDNQAAGAIGAGATNRRDKSIYYEGEIHFKGATKLDNGLEIGFRGELELKTDVDQLDEVWIDFRGTFGRVILGQDDHAARTFARIAPNGSRTNLLVGINEWGYINSNRAVASAGILVGEFFSGGTNGVFDKGDAEKVIYISPVFSGFQFGISYGPDGSENRFSSVGGANTANQNTAIFLPKNNGGFGDVFSGAVTFVNNFSGFGVNAMLGIESADPEASIAIGNSTLDADGRQLGFNGGLIVSFAGFDLGGTFSFTPYDVKAARLGGAVAGARTSFDDLQFDLGLAYTAGPWKVAATYFYGDYESYVASLTAGDSVRVNKYLLSGSYLIGPGLELSAGLAHEKVKWDALALTPDAKGTTLFVGTSFQF